MVETTLAVYSALQSGTLAVLTVPAAGGNNFVNDGTCFLHIVTGASPTTISVTDQALFAGDGAVHPQSSGSITANHTMVMGPFPRYLFNDAAGLCHFTSSETTLTKVSVVSCVMKG